MPGDIFVSVNLERVARLAELPMLKMADEELDALGDHYRSLCGSNSVLIRNGRVVTFAEFAIYRKVQAAVNALFANRRAE